MAKRLVSDVSDSFFMEVKKYCAEHPNTSQREVVALGVRAYIGSNTPIEGILETSIAGTEEGGNSL